MLATLTTQITNRLLTMTDGIGVTTHIYNPILVPAGLGCRAISEHRRPAWNEHDYLQLRRAGSRAESLD